MITTPKSKLKTSFKCRATIKKTCWNIRIQTITVFKTIYHM